MKIPEKYSKMLGTNENELIEMVSELTEKEIKELLTLLISAKTGNINLK